MGIPQSDTVQTRVSIPWTLGGQDHMSTGVTVGGLPAVDGEDDKVWDVSKYEREEIVRNVFNDGVFLGDVWGDGGNKDSFAVSYAAAVLTVANGRATVGSKRLDLGLTGTFDQDFTNAFVLPPGGSEKIVYLDVFQRSIEPPPAFTPAGAGMSINVYADFSVYNTADATIKEFQGVIPATLPAPAAGHIFLEIGRIDSAGTVTDTRTFASLKLGDPKATKADIVIDTDGLIGVNCTHVTFDSAMDDLLNIIDPATPADRKIRVYLTPEPFTTAGAKTLPDRVVFFSDSYQRDGSATQGAIVTATNAGDMFVFSDDYEFRNIRFANATPGSRFGTTNVNTPFRFDNVDLAFPSTGTILSGAGFPKIFANHCIFQGTLVIASDSKFFDCELTRDSGFAVSGGVGSIFQNCAFIFTTAGTISSLQQFFDCSFTFTGITLSISASTIFKSCTFSGSGGAIDIISSITLNGCNIVGNLVSSSAGGPIRIFASEVTGSVSFDSGVIEVNGLIVSSSFDLINSAATMDAKISSLLCNILTLTHAFAASSYSFMNVECVVSFNLTPTVPGGAITLGFQVNGLTAPIVIITIDDLIQRSGSEPPFAFNSILCNAMTIDIGYSGSALLGINVFQSCSAHTLSVINRGVGGCEIDFAGCTFGSITANSPDTLVAPNAGQVIFSGCNIGNRSLNVFAITFTANATGANVTQWKFTGCFVMASVVSPVAAIITAIALTTGDFQAEFVGCRLVNSVSGGGAFIFNSTAAFDWDVFACFLSQIDHASSLAGDVVGGGSINARTAIGPVSSRNVQY